MYSENPKIDAESFLQSQCIGLFFQPYQEGINLKWNKLQNGIKPKHINPKMLSDSFNSKKTSTKMASTPSLINCKQPQL